MTHHACRTAFAAAALLTALMLFGASLAVHAQEEAPRRALPPVEELGGDRYRIGAVTVDRGKRQLSVPGRVLHLDDTLEYIAVSRGGQKDYESLLELDASGLEFQLASILIGLDDADAVKPRYQFDEREALGPAVSVRISWDDAGETRSIDAANALLNNDEPFDDHDWVYIGSIEENGELWAQTTGTLIGFVHDPYAIIEHRQGVGVGNYGFIKGNHLLLPPEGAPVTVSVSVTRDKEVGKKEEKSE